jgi:L-threonylcarbamoyladenylate synthase
MKTTWHSVAKILKNGGVAVIPTDTLYGVVGSALSEKTVERIYELKGRDDKKPCIVLITEYKDLEKFGVEYNQKELEKFWPGKVSVVLSVENKKMQNKFNYLHRSTNGISFRMISPRNKNLFALIQQAGPLVAPSANPQGLVPAQNIWEAKKYFGNNVDVYMCGGTRNSKPSTLVTYKNEKIIVLRQGAVIVK